MPGEQDEARVARDGAGDAHDQRQVADQPVAHAEDDRAQRARATARAVPRLAAGRPRRRSAPGGRWPRRRGRVAHAARPARRALRRSQITACSRSSAAIAADLGRGVLGAVRRLLVALERLDEVGDGRGPEQAGGEDDEPDAHPRPAGRRHGPRRGRAASMAQMSAWRRSLPAIRRNASARRGSFSIVASASYRTIASRSSLRLSRLCSTSMGGTSVIVGHRRRVDSRPCLTPIPPLRYLAAADVIAAMPPLDERLGLAERTLTALVARRRAAGQDRRPSPPRRLVRRTPCRRSCAAPTRTAATTWSG